MTATLTRRSGLSLERLERRRGYLGASDVPVLFLSPDDVFGRTVYDLWASKVLPLKPDAPTDRMQLGLDLEPALHAFAERQLAAAIERDIEILPKPGEVLGANLDGLARIGGHQVVFEYKFVGGSQLKHWGDPGTSQVPDRVALQCQSQMFCADAARAYIVAAMVDGFDFSLELFTLDRDDQVINDIRAVAGAFWRAHVEPKVPPPESYPSIETLKRIERVPGKRVALDVDLYHELKESSEEASEAKKKHEAVKAKVIEALRDPETGEFAEFGDVNIDGVFDEVSYKEQTRRDIDADALKLAMPDVYEKFLKITSHRVLRVKERKF